MYGAPCFFGLSGRTLPPGVVDGILPGQDHLGDGDKCVALLEQALDDVGHGPPHWGGGIKGFVDGYELHIMFFRISHSRPKSAIDREKRSRR